jgi:hypothetical protein
MRQFWTDERWVRVTDEQNAPQFIGINQVVGYTQVVDFQTGQAQIVPQVENSLAEMDVDIMIEASPDYVALRQEQFEQLTQLAQQGVPIPPEMIIEASDLHDKGKFLEMMRQQREQAMQAQAGQVQQAMQMEGAKVQAVVQKDQSQAAKNMADAQLRTVQAQRAAFGL